MTFVASTMFQTIIFPLTPSKFNIDWDDYDNNFLRDHLDAHNTPDSDQLNPFRTIYLMSKSLSAIVSR